jgi:hypothetical protein
MCGSNAGSQLKLLNGVDVGTAAGGSGGVSLFVNGGPGAFGREKSDFAIAEVVVWPRGLTDDEMRGVSEHLIDRIRPPPTPLQPLPAAYPKDMNAWYCPGAFDLGASSNTWQDCSGNGNTAALSGLGLAESRSAGHGATSEVLALSGTTSSVISFGAVIPSEFTVCSVTRYTGGTKGRILNGGGANWLHGHLLGLAGVAHYDMMNMAFQNNVSPNTDWVVMCGTNAGSQLKLANGVDVGTAAGGTGGVSLFVNAGTYDEKSDFAIAEVVVWPRGLTSDEMRGVSEHLMNRLG